MTAEVTPPRDRKSLELRAVEGAASRPRVHRERRAGRQPGQPSPTELLSARTGRPIDRHFCPFELCLRNVLQHPSAFAPATADTSPLEASQRSALSRRRSGLWRQRSHRARPHSGRDRAARRTAARAVHVYPANNRGGAARRRVVIGTTWPRRRRKSAAARMTPGRRWAQNDVVRSEVGTNCAAGLAARRAARGGRSNAKS